MYIKGNGGSSVSNVVIGTLPQNVWTFFCVTSDFDAAHKGYINGELKATDTTALTTPTLSEGDLAVGIKSDKTSDPLDEGSLALLRIGAGAPTAEIIKKIYDDEKHLFQENAQFTTSDLDIKSVSYDDSTNLLYEGSTSGWTARSGLVVVDSGMGDASVMDVQSGVIMQSNN